MYSPAVQHAMASSAAKMRQEREFASAVADELVDEMRDLHEGTDRSYLRATRDPLAGLEREQLVLVAYNLAGRIARQTRLL